MRHYGAMSSSARTFSTFRFERSGTLETNPTQWTQRVQTAISAATRAGSASLTMLRTDSGTTGLLTLPTSAVVSSPQVTLAQAYGSVARDVSEEELIELVGQLDSEHLARMEYRPTDFVSSSVQAGYDPAELARVMSNVLPAGSWVRVDFREPSRKESASWGRWMRYNKTGSVSGPNAQHHSLRTGAVVASFTSGASDRHTAETILSSLTSAMPGFDTAHLVRPIPRRHPWFSRLLLAPLVAAVGAFSGQGLDLLGAQLPDLTIPPLVYKVVPAVCYLIATVMALMGLAALTGLVSAPAKRMRTAFASGRPLPPKFMRARVRPPHPSGVKQVRRTSSDGSTYYDAVPIKEFRGDYPLRRECFMVHPDSFAAIGSPHGSAAGGAQVSSSSAVPPALLRTNGPIIGEHLSRAVRLDPWDRRLGVVLFGKPGSGKSLLVRALYGWDCAERVNPSGLTGHPGSRNTMIAFESKGDGAAQYMRWAQAAGDNAMLLDVTDTSTTAVDVFAVPGDVFDRARFATAMFVYVYGEDSVGARSREAMNSVFPAAFSLSEEMVREHLIPAQEDTPDQDQVDPMGLAGRPRKRAAARTAADPTNPEIERVLLGRAHSAMSYAWLMLGGSGNEVADVLFDVVKRRAQHHPDDPVATGCWDRVKALAAMSPSARSSYTEAPRNKVEYPAVALDSWFTPTRRSGSWDSLLNNHLNVVINLGSPTGNSDVQVDDYTSKVLGSMLIYSLWEAIKRNCSDWGATGRWVSPYADELALLAGATGGGEVLMAMKDQGRSMGVRPTWATQRPHQVEPDLRRNLLAYDTLASFQQNDVHTAREIGEQLGMEPTELMHLPPYHIAMSTTVAGSRQPSVILSVPEFESDRASALVQQRQL